MFVWRTDRWILICYLMIIFGNLCLFEQLTVAQEINKSVNEKRIKYAAFFGTFASIYYISYTYMSFRFLEAGVNVHLYFKPYRSKGVLTVIILKWFWCAVQVVGQFLAQWVFARYMMMKYIGRKPYDEYMYYYDQSYFWQSINCYTVLLANFVLFAALILIKRQSVLKKNPNYFMLVTMATILTAETISGVLLNITLRVVDIPELLYWNIGIGMSYIKIVVQILICLIMLRILYVETKQEFYFKKMRQLEESTTSLS